ncbi:MAG: hypothetical protein ABIP99_22545 [Ilumatobacteraceae bacterium]
MSDAGCHAWAIPRTTRDLDGAIDLRHHLVDHEAQALDASGGNICAHTAAPAAVHPVDDKDQRRLDITRQTIDQAMIISPPLVDFPQIEDAGWSAIHDALLGRISQAASVAQMQRRAESILTADKRQQKADQ